MPGWCALLTVAMLAPVLGRGFLLRYDMSFVPRQHLLPDSLGLGSGLPRAVPGDALVASATTVIPGDILQQLILVGTVFAAGLGAARLVPTDSTLTRLVAATGYLWSAYLAERLLIGQWGLLVGYAALPWIAAAARRLPSHSPGHSPSLLPGQLRGLLPGRRWARRRLLGREWARLVLVSLPAVITPTGGLLAAGTALAAATAPPAGTAPTATPDATPPHLAPPTAEGSPDATPPDAGPPPAGDSPTVDRARPWWRAGGVVVVMAVLNAPWWVPALLHPGATSDPAAVAAFAARGENWGGPVLSVLGLGGIWNAEVVPASRHSPVLPLFTLLMVGLAGYGLWLLCRRWRSWRLAGLGGLGLLLALAGSLPGTSDLLEWAVTHLPGAGLLRDGQKWAAWWALPFALGFALGVEALRDLLRDRLARWSLAVGAVLLPLALLPDLGWGAAGRLEPVSYPRDWQAVSEILARDPRPGDVLTAPLSAYRRWSWNDDRTQYDPAPRYLPRPTVVADSLKVGGNLVRGEDRRAARVTTAARRGEPLGRHGIGWVLVEHGTPGPRVDVSGLRPVYRGEWLTLYRVPGPVEVEGTGWPPATRWVLLIDGLVVLFAAASAAALLRHRRQPTQR